MENEIRNENVENKGALVVNDVNELISGGSSETKLYTNINEFKTLFNLDNHVDYKINDCVGETIRVKEYLVKTIVKPLEPKVNEETGEVEEQFDKKRITILISEEGKSYVTASKMFGFDFAKLLVSGAFVQNEYVDIKIIKKNVKDSSNQALSFELV